MTDTPLVEATEQELAQAVEENLFALFRAMAGLPRGELVERTTHAYHHSFPPSPMFNGVWRTRLPEAEADAAIGETLGWFQARGTSFLFWWVGPETAPADLPARLHARGFAPNIAEDPGMAVSLDALPDSVPAPEGFSIRQDHERATLEDWRDVFCASNGVPTFAGQSWVDATLGFAPGETPWRMYTGYLDGRPVASNILFLGAGVAGIYGVGTIPEARGRGIGAAITLMPLLDARAAGYRHGVLFASELGHPVYRRLGFRDLPCRIGRYLWRQT